MAADRPFAHIVRDAKLRLLRMHYEARVGHIGGNLSALDILLCLHHRVMKADDLFVLSKGHGAGALYVTLFSIGALSEEDLCTFHKDGTRLAGHPPAKALPQIPFATGSLGHGLSLAAGLALGKKLKREPGRVFCLTSDGEWNEGSSWEALAFINHHRLTNLRLIVDKNNLQGFGGTADVMSMQSLQPRFREFGLETVEIDGHDGSAIERALSENPQSGPRAVLARTIKGHGVSFMENRMEWHYLPMTDAQYQQAVQEVTNECEKPSAARC